MKKINPKNYGLFLDGDFFDPDLINMEIVEDGKDIKISNLTEEQAKMALALAIRKLKNIQKVHEKISDFLVFG